MDWQGGVKGSMSSFLALVTGWIMVFWAEIEKKMHPLRSNEEKGLGVDDEFYFEFSERSVLRFSRGLATWEFIFV